MRGVKLSCMWLAAALLCAACGGTPSGARATHGAVASGGEATVPVAQSGLASWYSDSLAGHHTASGAPYDPGSFTAAHRTLPFGTRLRVVREDTGHAVDVVVNDRGPFGSERRILDLSRAAASTLGMLGAGVVRVRIEVIELGNGARVRRAGHGR